MINIFRDSDIKTKGTGINKLMPLVYRFGEGNRAKKKHVSSKSPRGFEKYFGLGIAEF